MSEDFKVINLNNDPEYSALVIMCMPESPYKCIDNIAQQLSSIPNDAKILIDELLHVGNTEKRYIEFTMKNGKLISGKIVSIPKTSNNRILSCDFLKDSNLLESSIISSIQYRMIKKGITI